MSQTFDVGEVVFHAGLGRGRILQTEVKNGLQLSRIAFNGQTASIFSDFLSKDAAQASAQIKTAQQIHHGVNGRNRSAASDRGASAEPYEMTRYKDIDPDIHKEWTVEDLMGEGEILIPFGAPGCGKSVIVGDMVAHIAAERDWFGMRTRKAAILYVAAERAQLVLRRFAAFRKYHDIDDLPIGVIKGYFDLAKARSDTDRIIATVKKLLAETEIEKAIIVIDTKRQVIGDENSDDIGKLVGNLSRIQHETKSGIIVIDHSPFHSPTKMAGRGELLSFADATIIVEKVGDVRTVTVKKANDGPDDLSFAFSLTSVSLGTHPATGKVTTAPVVVTADAPEPSNKSAGRLTNSEKIALEALELAIIEAGTKVPGDRVPNNSPAVSVGLWREYAYKRGISDAENAEAKKKAFQRARQALLAKNRIGTWGDHVWLAVTKPDISALLAGAGTRDRNGTLAGHVLEH